MARGYGKGSNRSGQGPAGKAPFSRAPVKAAVKPTTPNRNPNASGGPVRTGGGVGSNKHVQLKPAVASTPVTRKVSPGMAGNSGRAEGNHVMGSGKNGNGTIQRRDPPLHTVAKAPTLHGNAKALDIGRGGPGTGRTVHPTGSQSTWGNPSNMPGSVDSRGSITPAGSGTGGRPLNRNPAPMSPQGGGGPGSFGFRPGK
jgi:hypothetical protein